MPGPILNVILKWFRKEKKSPPKPKSWEEIAETVERAAKKWDNIP